MKGSCLCGAVEYEVAQLDGPIEHCSCRTCRKAHAAAFNTAAAVLREHFRWTRGEDRVKAHRSSPDKQRRFCGDCGTHLVADVAGRPHLILRVATLDEDPRSAPAFRIWQSHEVPWLAYGPSIPAYPEWEPGKR